MCVWGGGGGGDVLSVGGGELTFFLWVVRWWGELTFFLWGRGWRVGWRVDLLSVGEGVGVES